jgi:NTE family protein
MMEAHDRLYLENASFARTIAIPTLGVRSTDFDITPERVRALYRSGHEAASRFLDDWDFPAYVEQFRRGTVTSRRAQLHAQRPAG